MTQQLSKKADSLTTIAVCLIAACLFFAICGWQALNPTSINWLMDNYDFPQHYMGWEFFRQAPLWQFPIGLNKLCGLELSNSIVFTDSMPLYALLFHPFHALLPSPFQYFGFAILLCFVAQAFFGLRIAQTLTQRYIPCLLIATFSLISPVFLMRINCQISASNHWIILAGLWFYLRPNFARIGWIILFFLTSLLNYYFFPMIATLFCADILNRTIANRRMLPQMLGSLAVAFAVTMLTLFTIGTFMVSSHGMQMPSIELFRANLVTPFDPEELWSFVAPNLPTRNPYGEGFGYLGTGMFLLLLTGAAFAYSRRHDVVETTCPAHSSKYSAIFLACAALLFWGISLTYKISFLEYNLVVFSYGPLEPFITSFRATGRLFWLPFYIFYLGIFALLIRTVPKKVLIPVLASTLLIQLGDTYKAFRFLHDEFHDQPYVSPMQDPFWEEAAKKYTKVRIVFPSNDYTDTWLPLSYYACTHHMGINSFCFARFDTVPKDREDALLWDILNGRRNYDKDTLYVFTHKNPRIWELGRKHAMSTDKAEIIDGFKIVAPDWEQTTMTLGKTE